MSYISDCKLTLGTVTAEFEAVVSSYSKILTDELVEYWTAPIATESAEKRILTLGKVTREISFRAKVSRETRDKLETILESQRSLGASTFTYKPTRDGTLVETHEVFIKTIGFEPIEGTSKWIECTCSFFKATRLTSTDVLARGCSFSSSDNLVEAWTVPKGTTGSQRILMSMGQAKTEITLNYLINRVRRSEYLGLVLGQFGLAKKTISYNVPGLSESFNMLVSGVSLSPVEGTSEWYEVSVSGTLV